MKRIFRVNKYDKWLANYNNEYGKDFKMELGNDTINFILNGIIIYQEWQTVMAYMCVKQISFYKFLNEIYEEACMKQLVW